MRKVGCFKLPLWALAFAVPVALFGQAGRGALRIQVLDASGAGIARAAIAVELPDRQSRSLISDAKGQAYLDGLPTGEFRVSASKEGFTPESLAVVVHPLEIAAANVTLSVAEAKTAIDVRAAPDTGATETGGYSVGEREIEEHDGQPGRRLLDLVNAQPGWVYEDSGVLHPRGSEYDVQYVVDGLPVTEKISPAEASGFDQSSVVSMNVLTSGYPAEYGRKLGGVVEVTSSEPTGKGLHGRGDFTVGSFGQRNAGVALDYGAGRQYFSIHGQAAASDRYLDPPVLANFTNRGSSSSFAASYGRDLTARDKIRVTALRSEAGLETPNQLAQEIAGQRQDQRHSETLGTASYQRILSPNALLETQASLRDTAARLWSNDFATPVWAWQQRSYRQFYISTAASGHHGRHEWKAGTDAILGSVQEALQYRITDPTQFDPAIAQAYRFADSARDREQAAFVQDRLVFGNLAIAAGLRFDSYRLAVKETGWSPRLSVTNYFPAAGLAIHAYYDRVFQTPAVENILLASRAQTDTLALGAFRLPLRSARGNFYEAGLSKNISGAARFSANVFRRDMRNCPDDDPLLNTGISFPIAFARATVHGVEGKLELTHWKSLSGFLSYANQTGFGFGPVTGGLFLDGEALGDQRFALTQDQRNTARSLVRYQISRRWWAAMPASWGSGLPVEMDSYDYRALLAQYGAPVLNRVNLARGRVRPNLSIDAATGYELHRRDTVVTLQLQFTNLLNRVNVINFAGAFSGTTIAMTRSARAGIAFAF